MHYCKDETIEDGKSWVKRLTDNFTSSEPSFYRRKKIPLPNGLSKCFSVKEALSHLQNNKITKNCKKTLKDDTINSISNLLN